MGDYFLLFEYHKSNYTEIDTIWHEGSTCHINKTNDSTYIFTYPETSNNKEHSFIRVFNKSGNGYIIKTYNNNKLESTGFSYLIFPLVKDGKWTYYYPKSGKINKEEIYIDNQPISNRNWNTKGEEETSDVFNFVEVMPEFNGGVKELSHFIGDNIKYPILAREEGISGTVYITFIVMEDGSVSGIRILRGIGGGCDEESIRVVRLMNKKWKAGKTYGKPVRVQFNLPLKFNLT